MERLRQATKDEVDAIVRLEDAAGRIYAQAGLPEDLPGLPRAEVQSAIAEGLLWVVVDGVGVGGPADRPVAFALCQRKPGALHLRELDVDPAHMRRGLGRRLIEHVRVQAHAWALPWVTLTTFADVAWNAPLYRRYGFRELPREAAPPWLQAIRDEEDQSVLSRWPRVAMVLETGAAGP
jgi:GNAT superfamily N-acetyltransferase